MDEFPGLLAGDFGLRPQGKDAPMPAPKMAGGSAARSGSGVGSPPLPADLFGGGGLFGGQQSNHRLHRDDDVDAFFGGGRGAAGLYSSMPVYDKPVYDDDDDIFGGLPGTKKESSSASTTARHDGVFGSYGVADLLADLGGPMGSGDNKRSGAAYHPSAPPYAGDLLGGLRESKRYGGSANRSSPPYDDYLLSDLAGGKGSGDNKRSGGGFEQSPPSYEDDLLAGLGGVSKPSGNEKRFEEQDNSNLNDLIPGFGGSIFHKQKREPIENNHQQSSFFSTKSPATGAEDPFVVLETASAAAYSSSGLFIDPSEHIKPSGNLKYDVSSAKDGGVFDDINGFGGSMRSVPSFSFDMESIYKDKNPLETAGNASTEVGSAKASDNILPRTDPVDNDQDSYQTLFGKPSKITESYNFVNGDGNPTEDANVSPYRTSTKTKASQRPEENTGISDDVWLTVSEVHLFTQPTNAPPPSRPPPPPFRIRSPFSNTDENSSIDSSARKKSDESSSRQPSYQFPKTHNDTLKTSDVSSIDELEDFAMGKPRDYAYEMSSGEEEVDTTSTATASAAAMKEAMDKAEAKFKHAREVWERERDLRSSKGRETAQQIRDEEEKEKGRLEREREQREKEEKEKEQRRLEKMREIELEREREREKGRQAVERANREARERAAAEARQKAERAAREHAERVAVQRAQAEARERAAAEAKERAEKLAAERVRAEAEAREREAAEVRAARERAAREKAAAERVAVERAAAEVRARAQRAAVERAALEARERAAAEARERAAAMAREKQQKSEPDLDSFFGMGARANSVPRERSNSYESAFETQFQNNGKPSGTHKTSGSSSSMRRPSSTMNIMDDLTTVFRTAPSSDEFQEIEGEPEERRRARLEREQRTRERAAKTLAEKNERELQMQREQAERDRVSESLNTEIRRWAAGKEGNLRALLSTLQYVLWPDSGWQPVSLTDLITAASVKKVYRKATLCVHPDKVRSGSVQQKYTAEKVFDLLKEAWNKFNSEELF